MTSVIGRFGHRGKFSHRERMPCDNGGRDSSGAAESQGMPRNAGSHQKLEGVEQILPQNLQKELTLQHLGFRLLASRTVVLYYGSPRKLIYSNSFRVLWASAKRN